MRVNGDIAVIKSIEQYILKHTQCDVIKNVSHNPICSVNIEPSYYVKAFVIYTEFYEFDVRLSYDLRSNKGEFQIPNYNCQNLFIKYPELNKLLSQLGNIKNTEYANGKKTVEIIPIKETSVQTI